MNHKDILKTAAATLNDRHDQYGDHAGCFNRASEIASIILNKHISTYDIAMVLHCVKLARIQSARMHDDNYIDGINYLAFAGEFAKDSRSVVAAMEDDIIAMARKLAPEKTPAEG